MKAEVKVDHRGQILEYTEWFTWNNQPASAWMWQPTRELRNEMPWLPVSTGKKTLDAMKKEVDNFLDNVEKYRDRYNTTIKATAAWCEKYGAE